MELTSAQITEFDERGFLFFPELLKSSEIKLLSEHLEIYIPDRVLKCFVNRRRMGFDWYTEPTNTVNPMENFQFFHVC